MSNEENTGHEHDSAHPPAAEQSASQENRNEAPQVRESKLESEHADLPPMSVIGASAEPAAKPGTIAAPKQFGRRGTPRGAPVAPGAPGARPSIGVIENPAEAQESISGALAARPAAPQGERRERREPREPREHREHREPRERNERREERREPRHDGERHARREDRPRREDKPRLQIEPVVIPVQEPIGFWASLKRKLATLFGIPDKAVFVPSGRGPEQRDGRRDGRGGRHGGRGRDRGRSRGRDGRRGDRGHRGGPREG